MTKFAYKLFLFRPPSKLLSLLDSLSNYILKYATHHLHYRDKLVGNRTQTSIYAVSSLYLKYSLGSLGNLSTVFLFAYNEEICATQPDLVLKKREPPKITLRYSHSFQNLSLFSGSTSASSFLLADESSVKLTSEKTIKEVEDSKYHISIHNLPEISFNLFRTIQSANFLQADITLLNKQL